MRKDLPGGQWAELRTADEVLEEDREQVMHAMANAGDDPSLRNYFGKRQWVTQLVTNWSFEQPIPSAEPKSLGKIPLRACNKLIDQVQDVIAALNEDEETETPPVPSDS